MDTTRDEVRRLVVGTLMPGFVGTTVAPWVIREYAGGLAAVCLYGANVADLQQFSSLCADLRAAAPDLLVSVDEDCLLYTSPSPRDS